LIWRRRSGDYGNRSPASERATAATDSLAATLVALDDRPATPASYRPPTDLQLMPLPLPLHDASTGIDFWPQLVAVFSHDRTNTHATPVNFSHFQSTQSIN